MTGNSACEICNADAKRAWRESHRDQERAAQKAKREADREGHNRARREWQQRNPEKRRAISKRYYASHAEQVGATSRAWVLRNPDLARERLRAWVARNPDLVREKAARHKKKHRDRFTAVQREREMRKRQAMPPWADRQAIHAVYTEARRLSQETGVPHEVDHIVPLTHPLVCGLHVSWNLQAIPATENARKYNSFTPGSVAA